MSKHTIIEPRKGGDKRRTRVSIIRARRVALHAAKIVRTAAINADIKALG
jgi:hypothetical protein